MTMCSKHSRRSIVPGSIRSTSAADLSAADARQYRRGLPVTRFLLEGENQGLELDRPASQNQHVHRLGEHAARLAPDAFSQLVKLDVAGGRTQRFDVRSNGPRRDP